MKSDEIIEKIRCKLQESNPEQRSVVHIFQFNFVDNEKQIIKKIVFDLKNLNIYEGTAEIVDADITITDDDFYALGCRLCSFEELIDTEKVTIHGDINAVNKMMEKIRMKKLT